MRALTVRLFILLGLLFPALTALAAPVPPQFASAAFYGGAGDQHATGVSIGNGSIYITGNNRPETSSASDVAYLASYAIPPAATPVWARSWAYGNLYGVTQTGNGVYTAGNSYTLTTDNVGGKETKGIMAQFPLDGSNGPDSDGAVSIAKPNFFSYTGFENLNSVQAAVEGANTYLYAAGGGQPCSWAAYIVAKYDTAGTLIASATDSSVGISFNTCSVPSNGGSNSTSLTALNGNVYAAGYSGWASEGASDIYGRPTIWKYNSALALQWRSKDTTINGFYNAITSLGNAIYAVGYKVTVTSGVTVANSEDYLIEKYDEAGNLLWSQTSGGANTDILTGVVAIGTRLFAVGYTRSQGAGGADAVILEIDPSTGSTLSTTLYGGAQDDLANSVATDGTDLYIVGESKSFASAAGNVVGQNDLMLLRYVLPASASPSLSYSAETGYGTVGVSPATGTASTVFTYKAVYTQPANTAPSMISVCIDASPCSAMSMDTSASAALHDSNYANGEQYVYTTSLAAGAHTYYFTASDGTNSVNLPASSSLSGPTISNLSITTSTLPDGTVSAAYSQTLAVTGGTAPYTFSATSLPAGLSLNASTGVISGTPTTSGLTGFSVSVTDATSAVFNKTFSINVVASGSSGSSAWTTQAPMPTPAVSPSAAVINGIMYVAGGGNSSGQPLAALQAYNPATNSWSTLASMPGVRNQSDGGAVING